MGTCKPSSQQRVCGERLKRAPPVRRWLQPLSAGPTHAVRELLTFDALPQWQWDFLRKQGIDYVVVDRRVASTDNLTGYFYPRPSEADDPPVSNWLNVRQKYEELPGNARIYDSGDIVIYDIRRAIKRAEPPVYG